ncbi:MAG: hypothetical protein COA42_15970 [Alteromonadaceae bacterium]|nr:MAG: hypothetical protein COA42_15970 [Alteromonadaceae bacterium]
MKIRTAKASDYETVCNLCKELDDYHAQIFPERVKGYDCASRSTEMYRSYIEGDDRDLFIASIDDEPVGFLNLRIEDIPGRVMSAARKFVLVDNIYVSEAYRSTGLGRLLMEHTLSWSKGRHREDGVAGV